ncbi:MAG: hypothetical protein K6A32_03110 [Bacteroidales bacterium]|nr:hypothetical protein [Bacteroidales bacterium]
MAEINYYKLEQHVGDKDSDETRSVYRLKQKRCISGSDFIKEVAHRRGYSEATIAGVFIDAANELAELLGSGYSVELPGIGVFSIGVRMRAEEGEASGDGASEASGGGDAREKNARSLELHHVNFRKNKNLFLEVDRQFSRQKIKRIYGREGVRIKTSKYPNVKNRMYVAREFLASHPFMTVQDYADITGLSYSAAQRELKDNWDNPAYGITAKGKASHRVYVLSD